LILKKLQFVSGSLLALPLLASNALAAATYKPMFASFQSWPEFWGHVAIALLLSGVIWWKIKVGRPAQVLIILLVWQLVVTAYVPGAWYWAVQLLQLVAGIAAFFFLQ
jgi:hypothetical protein